ncbi:MAG: Re/Si-specific NAD(P)(+) transhydrogenase subunit alpha [Pirellulales bacterium]
MQVAVTKETFSGERRVALVPSVVPILAKAGVHVVVQAGAGEAAGFPDAEYAEKGARIIGDRNELFQSEVLLFVRALGSNPDAGRDDLQRLDRGQVVVGMCDPLGAPEAVQELAERGVTLLALEMMPRITRAQSMDVLSSMATIAGYKAVLLGANHLPKLFPMLMTAAGTLAAAKVFVIGAGVAGLQAIATARRLGAILQAYDVRPAVKEQIESLGAKFVSMELESTQAEGAGGYAKEMDEAFYQKQRELMARIVGESDVCITTAAIPGKPSPRLITADAVRGMKPGSVIVDLAAERGGNCELTRADQLVHEHGVTILGPTNLPSEVPQHASQMYAKNVATFLTHLTRDGRLHLDLQDEITRDTLLARDGQVVHSRMRDLLGLGSVQAQSTTPDTPPDDDGYELDTGEG